MKYHLNNLDSKIDKLFSSPNLFISEQMIIELQDIFLTPGIHIIDVESLQEGRSLIQKFLNALRCYQTIGCLTQHESSLPHTVFDIHNYLLMYGFLEGKNSNELEQFFTQDFNFDFIWIEKKADGNTEWADYFEQRIVRYEIDQSIPVILILYRS